MTELEKVTAERDELAAHVERCQKFLEDMHMMPTDWTIKESQRIHEETPETSIAHRIAHVAEQCDLPRLLRDYRAMVGLASITGPAKRERIEWAASVEIAIFGAEQKYVISATHGRKDND